ncbi:methyltransferase [Neisseria sp.]|uniref:methyltransferase n=1 Tax=Neisseria sp. TaxID=192066 RepID=UPI0035A1BC33
MNTDRWQIHRHLAETTDQRLEFVRREPQNICLVGADADISRSLLAARYPKAAFSEYDPRPEFLQAAAAARKDGFWRKFAGKTVPQTCLPVASPLPEAAADMLWANLSLITADDLPAAFLSWSKALKTDGLLFFTHFGRDTLAELKGRLKAQDIACETPVLVDMHDLGDMLAGNGFYDPVTDTAKLDLGYTKAETFWLDMETLGIWRASVFSDEAAARAAVDRIFAGEGRLNITLETVYGHALKKLTLPEGERAVTFFPKRNG